VAERFKIYYGDESTRWVTVEDLESAPRLDVQAISWVDHDQGPYGVGRFTLLGADYYVYVVKDDWFIMVFGETDLVDHVLHSGPCIVFKGRTIHNHNYRKIMDMVNNDPELPAKSAVNRRLETRLGSSA
jgi:hypothetical protein